MTPDFQDAPPDEPHVTAYDEAHLRTYLRVLDAHAANASWQEAAMLIFDIDPDIEPRRAKSVYERHLARAQWMTKVGYRDLLNPPNT